MRGKGAYTHALDAVTLHMLFSNSTHGNRPRMLSALSAGQLFRVGRPFPLEEKANGTAPRASSIGILCQMAYASREKVN